MKKIHDFTCQVCGVRIETAVGPYAEAAHLQPLGGDYEGPDIIENMLCLCPNDHARLDHGALFIMDDLKVVDANGREICRLHIHPEHRVDVLYLRAHQQVFRRP